MSAVEFGLAAPVFMAMLTPVIDLGLAFSEQTKLNQAIEAGAQYATANPYNGTAWATNVSSAITNAQPSLSFTPSVGSESCGCPNAANTAIVTGSYGTAPNCTAGGCPDGSNPGYYDTISGSITYISVMPYSILGSTATLSRQAVVRVQ